MCGIAGTAGRARSDRRPLMESMRDAVAHRGPDAAGGYVTPNVALGVRRLRIIDLLTGDQPQCNEDGSIWTAFNGEIYNYLDLRTELLGRGHRFKTASDTEIIPHLYEELGDRFVERLEGMFAIAVWDSRTGALVLARDRLGKKPLLYHERDGEITFASEHQALVLALPERTVSLPAIRAYLRLGYVPAPHDAFASVRKLPPAHVLVWRDGRSCARRYWNPPAPGTLRIGEAEASEEVRRLLERAVSRRLMSDVPLGAFLSGGVDSSSVVATMARLTPRVRTFSIGFEEAGYSELPYARAVAERYGTDHHEFVVRPQELEVLPLLVRHYGEPYADSSAVPTFHLSRLTREHVTVALSGDGGDELFGGYERYFAAKLSATLDRAPLAMRAARAVARALPDPLSPWNPIRRARRFLLASGLPARERYLRWLGVFEARELGDLLDPTFAAATAHVEASDPFGTDGSFNADPVAAAQALDLRLYLPDDLLVKLDIASMANSLEVRCPFLDRELVEFAVALPTELKIRGARRKYILKKAMEGIVPSENLHRRKQGFALPVGTWLRGRLRGFAEDVLLSGASLRRGYVRPDRLERLVRRHTTGEADHTHQVWSLLMLELWHREMVDRRPAVA